MPSVELIYEYIHQRTLLNRGAFAAKFDAPVLLFRRIVASEELGDRTRADLDGFATQRVSDKLAARQLQLRREAHAHRLVRLPPDGALTVGRTTDNDVPLPHRLVSRRHLRVTCTGGRVQAIDLGSKNGSYIDDQRLEPGVACTLEKGQELRVGGVMLRLMDGGDLFDALSDLTEQTMPPPAEQMTVSPPTTSTGPSA